MMALRLSHGQIPETRDFSGASSFAIPAEMEHSVHGSVPLKSSLDTHRSVWVSSSHFRFGNQFGELNLVEG